MLNPNLKLNQNLFEEKVEKVATRDGFSDGLIELGEKNPDIVVLTADLTESTKVDKFAKQFPQRFLETGVAEQNMAAIAAGLGVSGKTAFISSYAAFSPGKNLETIRTTIIYNNSDVKIAGHHAGLLTGPDGVTHQATEDIAIMRSIPNIKIIVPCDAIEAKKATVESGTNYGPYYLRFSREKTPVITTNDTPFDNKTHAYWLSDNPKATIFATGHILFYALLAAKKLSDQGINTIVANVSFIKPADVESILELAKKSGKVVTCEDHQVAGGLGSMIAEILSKNNPMPIEFIGLQDTFAQSASFTELLKTYKMDDSAIEEAVKKVIKR